MSHPKVFVRALAALAMATLTVAVLPSAAEAGVTFDNEISVTLTDGSATAVPGNTTTYTLTVSNAGPDAAQPTVSPTFSSGTVGNWTCAGAGCGAVAGTGAINDTASLSPGGSVTYSIPLLVPSSATGNLVASITVDPTSGTDDPANNTATDTDVLTKQADLSITKTDGVTAVQPGDEVIYSIVATNAGPSDTFGNVGDTLPPILQDASWTCVGAGGGTCTGAGTGSIDEIGNIPAGGSLTFTVVATVDPTADGSEVVANSANVQTGPGIDLNLANNLATDVDDVADFTADLVALKTAPTTAVVGGTISYTIGVRNDGPDLAREVVLDDALPAGTTFVSITQTTGPVATDVFTPTVGNGGAVQATWDSFADGATAEFTVVVQLGGTIAIGDAVVNTAEVDSVDDDLVVEVDSAADDEVSAAATVDPNTGNNDVTVTTLIVAQATTTTTTTTVPATTSTTARVGSGTLARTGGDAGGPTGSGMVVLGAGLVLVGAAELRRRRATM